MQFHCSYPTVIKLVLAVVASYLAWGTNQFLLIPISLIFPLLLGLAGSRFEAFGIALAYHGVVWFPCIEGSKVFFGHQTVLGGVVLWVLAITLCSAPFVLLWHSTYPLTFVAFLLYSLSPIGLGSPLFSAGVLFPGLRWIGLFLCLALVLLLLKPHCFHWIMAYIVLLVSLAANYFCVRPVYPQGWTAVNTHFGGAWLTSHNSVEEWKNMQTMIGIALDSPDHVTIFPETVISQWTPFTRTVLQPELDRLSEQNKTILWGSTMDHSNLFLSVGAQQQRYWQRIPIPIAMWGRGFDPHFAPQPPLLIDGRRVAVLLCYEQLLITPALQSFLQHPDVLVAPSNLYWSQQTSVEGDQTNCVRSWSRLFHVPYFRAINT